MKKLQKKSLTAAEMRLQKNKCKFCGKILDKNVHTWAECKETGECVCSVCLKDLEGIGCED